MSADILLQNISKLPHDQIVSKSFNISFDPRMHCQTVSETQKWVPHYLARTRLYLLVVYTGFFERFLKEITFSYMISLGHAKKSILVRKNNITLSKQGKAMCSPIMKSSTIPDMLDYAEELFDLSFGEYATEWNRVYKLRCATAHNGGFMTPDVIRDLGIGKSKTKLNENTNIELPYEEFKIALKYADKIATMIDKKTNSYSLLMAESELVFRELFLNKSLPPRKNLWEFLHKEYKIAGIKRPEKLYFEQKYYMK